MRIFLYAAILFALILDSSLISLPIVLALCILLYVVEPRAISIGFIFFVGIILDALRITPLGATSLFLLLSCGFIYIYRNTFELKDLYFIVLLPFIFSYIYAVMFGYNNNIFIYIFLFLISEGSVYYLSRTKKSMIHAS